MILEACEAAAWAAGFRRLEMGATLTGVPFYRAKGYVELEAVGSAAGGWIDAADRADGEARVRPRDAGLSRGDDGVQVRLQELFCLTFEFLEHMPLPVGDGR